MNPHVTLPAGWCWWSEGKGWEAVETASGDHVWLVGDLLFGPEGIPIAVVAAVLLANGMR